MLKKKPLKLKSSKNTLVLNPTPYKPEIGFFERKPGVSYLPYNREYNKETSLKFFAWFIQNCPEDGLPAYKLAEMLDVHRIVIEDWLYLLWQLYYAWPRCKLVDDKYVLEVWYPDKRMKHYAKEYLSQPIKLVPCSDYDPWTDREWDDRFHNVFDPFYLDTVVDKYYSVFKDEQYCWEGKKRKGFLPLLVRRESNEHPLYFKKEKIKEVTQKSGRPNPPPLTRKKEIEKLCYSGKQETFSSWLPSGYFDELPYGKVAKSSKKIPQKGAIKRRRLKG